MDLGLSGRVAAITGATSGIGAACARALAQEGCEIVAADLRPAPAGQLPEGWLAVEADVASADGGRRVVDAALERFGRLDVLVACAGIYETGALDDVDADRWDQVMAVNLRGTFLCAQAAIAAMRPRGWGRVITLASIAARNGGRLAGPAYVASKAGVVGLTRSLAHAAGPHGITVNCVAPGVIDTPMTGVMGDAAKAQLAGGTPLRRNGRPEEVADVVAMLASERAGFVHGALVDVNGGLAMG
ncbi:SDR family NAD(P)-dependent oxidoreductase [Conexibacter stalactiti]|uniref:SDR family NAD(P)-dependent oxidoreductase n=1 Tax=Conexibacter stalactiti TaxID=1940611 RepID=A0ABU4HLD7_9ACTN|nr:SDR family NAD(P)-dependent oxidoreductase [Conexibacter stalactiti]MDW5594087.1 SDR family NAD(P)-dependent oxidoreductase [Conexibacter stalactiti]MEC5034729.1 SDR family NAD(P)-dependent oxidoreductase [Conexibacter stalactiti]